MDWRSLPVPLACAFGQGHQVVDLLGRCPASRPLTPGVAGITDPIDGEFIDFMNELHAYRMRHLDSTDPVRIAYEQWHEMHREP